MKIQAEGGRGTVYVFVLQPRPLAPRQGGGGRIPGGGDWDAQLLLVRGGNEGCLLQWESGGDLGGCLLCSAPPGLPSFIPSIRRGWGSGSTP